MKLFVRAKANAKTPRVERVDETHFIISVKAPAQDGKANEAVGRALAEYLDVPPSQLTLKSGKTSKQKVWTLDI